MDNIFLIALDLDGTLLNRHGTLSDANRKALLCAMSKGVHVCICTGRAFDTIPQELLTFPGIEYAITNNGASVYRILGKDKINSLYLEPDAVLTVLEQTRGYNVSYEAFMDGSAYASREYVDNPVEHGASISAVNYIKSTRHPVENIEEFIKEHINELESLDVVVGDSELKDKIIDRIKAATRKVYITSSVKQLIEISIMYGGKRTGLCFLAKYLNIGRENIAAFGDADNDIDMLDYAGCGIAMANASHRLLEVADYVTTHHDEDGVAYAINNILHIL